MLRENSQYHLAAKPDGFFSSSSEDRQVKIKSLLLPGLFVFLLSSLQAQAADIFQGNQVMNKDLHKPAKAESHMQRVLDALAILGEKPIETLTPEEARKQ